MKPLILKKLATTALLLGSVVALATLGDGGVKKSPTTASGRLLSYKPAYNYRNFSLKTGYQYRGAVVFRPENLSNAYVLQPTNFTFQRGNTTYIVPLKRKVLADKIKIGPVNARY